MQATSSAVARSARGQPGVRLMTAETTEKIHWKARLCQFAVAKGELPARGAPVFESLYVYISSGAPSRSVE